MRRRRTYLDWAAAAPVSARAWKAFEGSRNLFGNPSSPHEEGRAAQALLTDARVRIARLAGVKPDAVIFTAGATEANALAIVGQVNAEIAAGKEPGQIGLARERPGADGVARAGVEEEVLPELAAARAGEALTLKDAHIDLAALKTQIRPETRLVALEVICGETGTRFDTRGVRQMLDQARTGREARIRLHADASQLPLVESFELTRIASDTLALDAQKVGGVRGIGVLLAPRQVPLKALIEGGGQERGLRPGTESPGLAAAFAAALEEAHLNHASFALHTRMQRERLLQRIEGIPSLVVNGGKAHAPHILNVSLLGRDTDYLAALLNEAGFAVSTRSACATDAEGSVAVLAYSGDEARAASTLRISWGPSTPERDLVRFADALVRAVRFMDANAV